MNRLTRLTLAGVLLAAAVPARAGEVKVSFSNGRVTIVATDATPRQIIAEWARLGQVKVTNVDRLPGGPLTLQLTDVPEAQALETLLRGAAGYVAAPRTTTVAANASQYDRILLMPGAAPTAPAATAASSAAASNPARSRPSTFPVIVPNSDDTAVSFAGSPSARGRDQRQGQSQDQQAMQPGVVYRMPGGIGTTTPQPTATQPAGTAPGAQRPSFGATVPGMPTAAPQAPAGSMYSGTPGSFTPTVMSSPVPGQITALPSQPTADVQATPFGAPTSTGPRPGEPTGPPTAAFQNPYGLPEPVKPPVTDPNATPYGLPNPVKPPTTTNSTTPGSPTPGATTPGTTTRPIKSPQDEG